MFLLTFPRKKKKLTNEEKYLKKIWWKFEKNWTILFEKGEVDKNGFCKTHVWSCWTLELGNKRECDDIVTGEGISVHLLVIPLTLLVQTNGSKRGKMAANERTMLCPRCINSPFLQKSARKTYYASWSIWQYSYTQSSKVCNMDGMTTKRFILLAWTHF